MKSSPTELVIPNKLNTWTHISKTCIVISFKHTHQSNTITKNLGKHFRLLFLQKDLRLQQCSLRDPGHAPNLLRASWPEKQD